MTNGRIIEEKGIESFKRYLFEEEKSRNTIDKYVRDVRAFAEWAGERELSKTDILEYKSEIGEKYAPRSVNSMLSSLNAFFAFKGWCELRVKTLKIQRAIFADEARELTKREYERLLEAARRKKNERLYYLMQTMVSTGLRISELAYISVEAVAKERADISCKGKIRCIFLPKQLCKMLRGYIKKNKITAGPVFVTSSGKPLHRTGVWKMLKRLCRDAGVKQSKVFPHNFRHLFAKTYYTMEKDIVRLADILGHSSINTTRIYTLETGSIHRRQLQRLGLLRC